MMWQQNRVRLLGRIESRDLRTFLRIFVFYFAVKRTQSYLPYVTLFSLRK